MSDLFKCDHCQDVRPKSDKAGVIIIQQCIWGQNGIAFPNRQLHQHDLCKACLTKILELIMRPQIVSYQPKVEMVPVKPVTHAQQVAVTSKLRQLKQWFEHKLVFNTKDKI
jgi:hypothetical protein